MYRASSTGCIAFLKRAFLKTLLSIFQQGRTLYAQSIGVMILTPIQIDHLFYGLALSSELPVHDLESIGLLSPTQAYVIVKQNPSESPLVFRISPWKAIFHFLF